MVKVDASRDYYADLELPANADSATVKKQYRKLVLQWHPDRNQGREAEVNARFQAIQSAYEILNDTEQRAKYDAVRARTVPRATRFAATSAYAQGRAAGGGATSNPYANAGAGFPPPPRAPTARQNPPASAGARRWSKFDNRPTGSARPPPDENEARANAYQAWERMRHGNNAASGSPKPRSTASERAERAERAEAATGAFGRKPPPVPNRPNFGQARPNSFDSRSQPSTSSYSARKNGFMPSNPGGDEPQAARTSAYTTRGPRESVPRFYGPEESSDDEIDDPLKDFGEKMSFEPRLSTPYATHGGEKTNPFDAAGVNRSKSTRETTDRYRTSDANIFGQGSSRDRHRSASPHINNTRREGATSSFKTSNGTARAPADDGFKRTQFQAEFSSAAGKFTSASQSRTPKTKPSFSSADTDSSSDSEPVRTPSQRVFAKPRSSKSKLRPDVPLKAQPNSTPNGTPNGSSNGIPNGTPFSAQAQDSQSKPSPSMYATHRSYRVKLSRERLNQQTTTGNSYASSKHQLSSEAGDQARDSARHSSNYDNKHDAPPKMSRSASDILEERQYKVLDNLLKRGTSHKHPTPSRETTSAASRLPQMPSRIPEAASETSQTYPDMFSLLDRLCQRRSSAQSGRNPSSTSSKSDMSYKDGDECPGSASSRSRNLSPDSIKTKPPSSKVFHWHPAMGPDLRHRFSFSINNGSTPSLRPEFKPRSVENIHTKFSSQDWDGKFEAGNLFSTDQQATPSRTKSPIKPRGRSPTKSKPAPNPPVIPPTPATPNFFGHAKEPERAASSPGEAFSATEWTETIKSDMFAFPPPSRGGKASFAARATPRTGRSNVRKPQDRTAFVENEDDEEIPRPSSGGLTPASKSSSATAAASPNAMDIDTPGGSGSARATPLKDDTTPRPGADVRNVNVEPSRPEWRPGNIEAFPTAGKPEAKAHDLPGGKRRVTESSSADGLKTSLNDLNNVAPLFSGATGLDSLADLNQNLPFKPQASRTPPVAKAHKESEDLDLPHPPKAPIVPIAIKSSLPPSQSSWDEYLASFKAYMSEWDLFTTRMVQHFSSRKRQVDAMPPGWLEAKGNEWIDEYRKGLRQDLKVREWWSVASERHSRAIDEFYNVRELMKDKVERA